MDAVKFRGRPEEKIQTDVENFLRRNGWFVKRTHGSALQAGWPDDFASHPQHGMRWIEFKLPMMKGSRFTSAQLSDFPKFVQHGAGIWILTGIGDYGLLFKPANFIAYMATHS